MVFSKPDLEQLERDGLISFGELSDDLSDNQEGNQQYNHLPFSAFSLNVRLGRLMKKNDAKDGTTMSNSTMTSITELCDLTQDDFMKTLDDIALGNYETPDNTMTESATNSKRSDRYVMPAHRYFFWQPREKIILKCGFYAEITSRSSWARLGVRVDSATDDNLKMPYRHYDGRPLCRLGTTGTSVMLSQDDEIGQIFVRHSSEQRYVTREMLKKLIENGEFGIERHDVPLDWDGLNTRQNQISLTMGKKIRLYNGNILTPGKSNPDDFTEIELDDKGLYLPQGAFFISASEEKVAIPKSHIGNVHEYVYISGEKMCFGPQDVTPLPFTTHANAAYVGPKTVFTGNITFENCMKYSDWIFPGMLQSVLELEPLSTPIEKEEKSRYFNQNGATASKL